MNDERYRNYLMDLAPLVFEKLGALSRESEYELGQAQAYYDVLDLMKSQSDLFGISLRDLSLDGMDLEGCLTKSRDSGRETKKDE